MWDNEDVNFQHKSSMSNIQRLNYSQHCGSNCAKGAIFTQHCSYSRVEDNFLTSRISDTELFCFEMNQMMMKSMLKKQQDFQDEDLVDREAKDHHIVTEKGFMIALEAFFA